MVYSRFFLFSCLLCIFQQVTHSAYYLTYDFKGQSYTDLNTACLAAVKKLSPNYTVKEIQLKPNSTDVFYCFYQITGSRLYAPVYEKLDNCPPAGTNNGTASFRKNGELFTAPSSVCINKCLYDFKNPVIGQEVRSDGHITTVFVGTAISKYSSCPTDTANDDPPPLNPCKKKDDKGNFVDKDYCDAPPDGCPSGYIQGMFNGKKICVKQDQNNKDNCKPTVADPYKCSPNKPDEPKDPDQDGKCPEGKVQVIIGSTLKCVTPEVPPDPDGKCPKDYVKQVYEGVSMCVPNNQRPDAGNNCPLNTTLTTLPDGSKVCKGNGDNDGGGGASEPTGGDGDGNGS